MIGKTVGFKGLVHSFDPGHPSFGVPEISLENGSVEVRVYSDSFRMSGVPPSPRPWRTRKPDLQMEVISATPHEGVFRTSEYPVCWHSERSEESKHSHVT
jgi:hypothetical protein